MSAISKYLAAIGRRGGKAGKGSAAKAASAKKANAARWKGHRKTKRVTRRANVGISDPAHQSYDCNHDAMPGSLHPACWTTPAVVSNGQGLLPPNTESRPRATGKHPKRNPTGKPMAR